VRRLQDGGLPRQGRAEGGLAESQERMQDLAVHARQRDEQRADANLFGGEIGKVIKFI